MSVSPDSAGSRLGVARGNLRSPRLTSHSSLELHPWQWTSLSLDVFFGRPLLVMNASDARYAALATKIATTVVGMPNHVVTPHHPNVFLLCKGWPIK